MLAAGGLHQAGSAVESVVGTFQNASSSAKGPNCQGGQLCVTVLGDTIVEPNETGLLNLTSVSDNAYIGDGQGVRTIVNDDK